MKNVGFGIEKWFVCPKPICSPENQINIPVKITIETSISISHLQPSPVPLFKCTESFECWSIVVVVVILACESHESFIE